MIVDIRTVTLPYPSGTVITSEQKKQYRVSTHTYDLVAGHQIQLSEGLTKILIIEQRGMVRFERTFFEFGDDPRGRPKLYPICTKAYLLRDGYADRSDVGSTVLISLGGVAAFHNRAQRGKPDDNFTFTRARMWHSLANDVEQDDPIASEIIHSYFDRLCGDTTTPDGVSAHVYPDLCDPVVTSHEGINLDYPWDYLAADDQRRQRDVYDLTREAALMSVYEFGQFYNGYEVGSNDDGGDLIYYPGNSYEVLTNRLSLTDATIPGLLSYGDVDEATLCCSVGPLSPKELFKHTGVIGRGHYTPLFSVSDPDAYEPITCFTSKLLELLLWVHKLPISEGFFRYILSSEEPIEQRFYERHVTQVKFLDDSAFISQMQNDLRYKLLAWDPKVVAFFLFKSADDQVYMTITYRDGSERNYFTDLGLASAMSQGVMVVSEGESTASTHCGLIRNLPVV